MHLYKEYTADGQQDLDVRRFHRVNRQLFPDEYTRGEGGGWNRDLTSDAEEEAAIQEFHEDRQQGERPDYLEHQPDEHPRHLEFPR